MATDKQIAANRLNAQLSTGPRTEEGKAASSRNAIKHGLFTEALLIPGEDQQHLEDLRQQFLTDYLPAGAEEELLVEEIASSAWLVMCGPPRCV